MLVLCPSCTTPLEVPDDQVGRIVLCPDCHAKFVPPRKTALGQACLIGRIALPWLQAILWGVLVWAMLSAASAPTWAWVVFWIYVPVLGMVTLLAEAVPRKQPSSRLVILLNIGLVYAILSAASASDWTRTLFVSYAFIVVLNALLEPRKSTEAPSSEGKQAKPSEQQPGDGAKVVRDEKVNEATVEGCLTLATYCLLFPLGLALLFAILSGINTPWWGWLVYWTSVLVFGGTATGYLAIAALVLRGRDDPTRDAAGGSQHQLADGDSEPKGEGDFQQCTTNGVEDRLHDCQQTAEPSRPTEDKEGPTAEGPQNA